MLFKFNGTQNKMQYKFISVVEKAIQAKLYKPYRPNILYSPHTKWLKTSIYPFFFQLLMKNVWVYIIHIYFVLFSNMIELCLRNIIVNNKNILCPKSAQALSF